VIGLANAGGDTVNAIKAAADFGIVSGGQSLAGLPDLRRRHQGAWPPDRQGLVLSESFYWDLNDETRAFSKRFRRAPGR
jgi:branched-chain amino acid transport system substrate-binding protein